jgi:hypothetical protein
MKLTILKPNLELKRKEEKMEGNTRLNKNEWESLK